MRKALSVFLTFTILVWSLVVPVYAEENSVYSTEAAVKFCRTWNDYYSMVKKDFKVYYRNADDGKSVERFIISYNDAGNTVGYNASVIPDDAIIDFTYDPIADLFGFYVYSGKLTTNLEKATVYTDDNVYNQIVVQSNHDETEDMWLIVMAGYDVSQLLTQDPITVRLTIDGKTEFLDISLNNTRFVYEMVQWLLSARLYTCTGFEDYLNSKYLPAEFNTGNSQSNEPETKAYSFRDDYEAIDKTAK